MMIHRFESTSSTMTEASVLAAAGAPHGTAVVAERQTAGIGRHGHSWHSSEPAGLYLSIVLRLPDAAPCLTLALGLAAQAAINDLAQVSVDIRWPNDLMLNEKKVGGILVQAEGGAFIAGIGVNVNQESFSPELAGIATSLRIETGAEHSKEALMQRIIAESLRFGGLPKSEILRRFTGASSWVSGKSVIVDEKMEGVTDGLDSNGFLKVRTVAGIETVLAGGVRARE
jgi:BirA family biotin operon repressor/biotin-[acetyl-CoA-carboxylase] ligase